MKYYKYNTLDKNRLIDSYENEFADLKPGELQIELDWELPVSIQPLKLYRYNDISLEVEEYVADKFVIEDMLDYDIDSKPVSSINYKSDLRDSIYPERFFDNGFLTSVNYYKTRDGEGGLSDKVLQVDMNYVLKQDAVHESAKTVESRQTIRRWVLSNNGLDEETKKTTLKFYPHITESRSEGRRRRSNIFNIASKDIVILLMFTETAGDQEAAEQLGLSIVGTYEAEFNNFTKVAAAQQLIDVITSDSTYGWLNNIIPSSGTVQFLVPKGIIGESIRDFINRSFSGAL